MCLYVDEYKTELERSNLSPRHFLKVFVRNENYLVTPYHKYKVVGPGILVAPAKNGPLMVAKMVSSGVFHARTTGQALKPDLFWCDQFELGFCVVLEIIVQANDIVAYGNQDNVAFTRYEIAQAEWDRAIKTKEATTLKELQKWEKF